MRMHGIKTVEKKVEMFNISEKSGRDNGHIKTAGGLSMDAGGYTRSMCDCWYLHESNFRTYIKTKHRTVMKTGINAMSP